MDWLDAKLVENVVIVIALVYVLFEVILNLNKIPGDTSNVLLYELMSKRFFSLSFGFGAVLGHLFLGADTDYFYAGYENHSFYWALPVITLVVVLLVLTLVGMFRPYKKKRGFLVGLLLAGMLYGHFFWSMNFQSKNIAI